MTSRRPASMRSIRQERFGGPDVLQLVESPLPVPAEGEALVRVALCGVNYADVMGRQTGNNYVAESALPMTPGVEVVGTLGDTGVRVAAICGMGGYAQWVSAPRDRIFPIPDEVDDRSALALLIQGLTAWFLYRNAGRFKQSDTVAVHGAAGGVGSLAVQIGRLLGAARIIATASSESKRRLALDLGADAAIDSDSADLSSRLMEANHGRGIDLIFDRAGGAMFEQSFDALATFGRLVVYGTSSGSGNEINTRKLIAGTRCVSGLWIKDYLRDPALIRGALNTLYRWRAAGYLKPVCGATYPLHEAARAHADLSARGTMGKLFLDANA